MAEVEIDSLGSMPLPTTPKIHLFLHAVSLTYLSLTPLDYALLYDPEVPNGSIPASHTKPQLPKPQPRTCAQMSSVTREKAWLDQWW